jgi:AraC family ethanolamine operon transcriptional activator
VVPSLINRMNFSSEQYDEFANMFTVADVEQKTLESGHFKGEVKIIRSPNVMINNFRINRKVLQIGSGIPDFITFTIWDPNTLFTWKNHEMKKGMIGVIWNNEHQSVTGSEFSGIPVSINENFLSNLCRAKGYFELMDKLKNVEILKVLETDLEEIRNLSSFIIENADLPNGFAYELLENNLVNLLLDCLANALPEETVLDVSVQKFSGMIDFIHDNLRQLTSVNQIFEETGIPERTARRLIGKKYGISPKTFLSALRLNEVRKLLLSNDEESHVFQVASEYSYWHMGQFGRDYKHLFGELPSQTLKLKKVSY